MTIKAIVISDTEVKIAQLLADGLLKKQIGDKIGLKGKTVERYLYDLRKRCECPNTYSLVAFLFRNKLLK